jgi:hypothetical protein
MARQVDEALNPIVPYLNTEYKLCVWKQCCEPQQIEVNRECKMLLVFTLPSVSQLSKKCESLDVSQPYGPSWPVTGIALPFFYLTP